MRYAKTLPGRILEIVGAPRWGGGLHRDQLAYLVGRHPSDKDFDSAIWMLYGSKRIDFAYYGQYVILPTAKKGTP